MAKWDWISIVFISFTAMFIGGASGATVGGIKMIRAILIEKVLRFQVKKTFYSSNVVKIMKFNHKTLMEEDINGEFTNAITIAFLFFVLILVSSILVTCIMGDITSFPVALVESASAQCTVGLSSGITDPSIPDSVELIYILQMWSGRLEIIPVLALIRAIVLGTNPFKN